VAGNPNCVTPLPPMGWAWGMGHGAWGVTPSYTEFQNAAHGMVWILFWNHPFLILQNSHSYFYNSTETRYMFSICISLINPKK